MSNKVHQKVKFSTVLLYIAIALSVCHIAILMLGLFNVLTPAQILRDSFNYIVAFVLLALCLCFYICVMWIEKAKKLVVPEWFKVILYIGFFVFTNVYYYFGLYGTLAGLIIFYIFFAVVLNIVALALFFNTQQQNNSLKVSTTFTTVSTFCYALCGAAIVETVISALKLIFASSSMFATLSMFVIDMCVMILVSLLFAIAFSVSLTKKKVLINNCLIRYYK